MEKRWWIVLIILMAAWIIVSFSLTAQQISLSPPHLHEGDITDIFSLMIYLASQNIQYGSSSEGSWEERPSINQQPQMSPPKNDGGTDNHETGCPRECNLFSQEEIIEVSDPHNFIPGTDLITQILSLQASVISEANTFCQNSQTCSNPDCPLSYCNKQPINYKIEAIDPEPTQCPGDVPIELKVTGTSFSVLPPFKGWCFDAQNEAYLKMALALRAATTDICGRDCAPEPSIFYEQGGCTGKNPVKATHRLFGIVGCVGKPQEDRYQLTARIWACKGCTQGDPTDNEVGQQTAQSQGGPIQNPIIQIER